jgi:heat shock protein HslJ
MLHRFLIAAAGLLAASPALAQGGDYRAVGTEPFWSVAIEGGRISVPTPRGISTVDGRVHRSRRLIMRIQEGRSCSDGMSDRIYADTVRVSVDGRELDGCGEASAPRASLAGTRWEIASIDGARVPGGERYRVSFEANSLSGRAGCNTFSGSYRVGRDGFQAGSLAMTRMYCPGAAMRHEQAFSRILASRVRLYYPDARTLIMRGPAGEIRLRRIG